MFGADWADYALDQLADVFVSLDLATQDQLTAAIEALNRRLATDPLDEGESRNAPFRVTFVGSRGVLFRVDAAKRAVQVTEVRWYGP
jgi:hypothetical protein